jgi:hypothetical protein
MTMLMCGELICSYVRGAQRTSAFYIGCTSHGLVAWINPQHRTCYVASKGDPGLTAVVSEPKADEGRRSLRFWHMLTAGVLGAAALYYIVISFHWRIMVDSAVMHYVVFLMRHGRAPYTQISDNNMPGAYFVEWLGMLIFGGSDLGWRFFEFTVLAALAAGLVDLARRWDAFAGIFAAGLFVVAHSAEGPQYAAERELTLSTLLVIACALLFRAVEEKRPWLLALFGLATGLAASIKPTCLPLALLVLAIAGWRLHRERRPVLPVFAYGLGAMALVFAADILFLAHFHAIEAFRFILQHVIPAYVGMGTPMPYSRLLLLSLPRLYMPLIPLVLYLAWSHRRRASRWHWQHGTLLLFAGFGLFSFLIQRKGFLHHRYTFELFVFLLFGIEIFPALRRKGPVAMLAVVALLYALAFAVPRTLRNTAHETGHTDLELAMQSDLDRLGGTAALQDKVQCFDLVYGCLDALYHLRIVENASFTGDLLFFPVHQPPSPTSYYRDRFWAGVRQYPPQVIVLTNQNLVDGNSFDKVQRWPEFAAWLAANYTPVVERHFTYEHFGGRFLLPVPEAERDAYRIYVRNGSSLQQITSALQTIHYTGES